ncbi:hypothetical protein Cgig2_029201 [Carnegiea gigantea]|uniref:Uncharacterized protein n=1 Tax=Carnegiea gigantea TaxID=171969 RepID=A0A9Q1KLV6_9CARY|nr:hypothetical protein Cgig2_029201 [Carnegiea gigantea]
MDGSDPWISRLSSSSSARRYQLRSESYLGGDDFDVEDEYKQEFSCPFCAEEFDIVGLYIHIEEEHQMELKQGRKRRLRKSIPNSMFNILRKELRDGNRQSLFGGSSFMLSSSNPDTDPLLSSFIYSSSCAEEVGKEAPPPPEKENLLPQPVAESSLEW